jgi:uncharacterized membrane protein YozB (DUF420 family)
MPGAVGTEASSGRAPVVIALASVAVCVVVALVLYAWPARPGAAAPGILPALNASLNAAAAVCLLVGWRLIRARKQSAHRACMLAALALSTLFLVGYVVHHARVGSVPFRGEGLLRGVYFAVLIPHVLLAAAVVPLALVTLHRAWSERFDRHRRIARVTLPIWLFVSVSGVVVYLLLYHLPV